MNEKEIAEIWKIVRENAEGFKELREQSAETDRQMKETDQRMKETDRQILETKRSVQETTEQMKATDKKIAELNRELSKKMAFLTDAWGEFVEDLIAPAVKTFYESKGNEVSEFMLRQKSRINGQHMEVDVICYVEEAENQYTVAVVSVKNHMRPDDINKLLSDLEKFFDFFPQYRNCRLNAIAAGVRFDPEVVTYAQRKGVYAVVPSGKAVEFQVPDWFEPKVWKYEP
ncbi:MAG: hypothetical protein NUW37_12805, partial [Planctomycetes bacterium]|nr:hypothetical protein [Planctomycetota bacterium]